MTNAEAIEILSENPVAYPEPDVQSIWDEALDMAIAALEKQEGKKPTNVRITDGRLGDSGIKSGECPSCGEEVVGNWYGEYCGICGQKLDWSDAYGSD